MYSQLTFLTRIAIHYKEDLKELSQLKKTKKYLYLELAILTIGQLVSYLGVSGSTTI